MKTTRITAALLAALLGTSGTLAAQGARQYTRPLAFSVPESAARKPYDPEVARAQLQRAHQLGVKGRFADARRVYAAVAKMQKQADILPDEALWQVASFDLFLGNKQRAAVTLDELAEAAERHGNPVVQARALLEAAILHHQAGNRHEARARLQRLEPLLSSPFLTAQQRAEIEHRIDRS